MKKSGLFLLLIFLICSCSTKQESKPVVVAEHVIVYDTISELKGLERHERCDILRFGYNGHDYVIHFRPNNNPRGYYYSGEVLHDKECHCFTEPDTIHVRNYSDILIRADYFYENILIR